jgi:hypothetical protein
VIYADLSYNYDVNYTASDWWSGELTDNSNSSSDSSSFAYIFENGKWVIKSADFHVVNYY